ncbi:MULTISPECIES: superoxide dismutase family protein [Herbaspirillum]|uniref:Superoxide dismutase [Cu-Zn] n=1 Tax=Herbaspirillum rubrisubalbicans Os34 TaxID=1235827 RepID=A0A6M3ZR25_9BURK|nr:MULTISPECIES: superoxide dismutase family protein [Herbaspirillum]MCP1572183.1 Cu-Zn family superoxide dismutase [Herbaspirillum rubrisubalbicans]QJQ00821.1 superoxide dismutase [Cu-Zn] SodC2 [Herbaspirillum rubrisubalbicans Os34]
MKRTIAILALLACGSAVTAASAAEPPITVALNLVNAQGVASPAGEVTISETPYGLLFKPALSGLPAGVHGFHVHQNPSCAPLEKDGKMEPALAAGGHWDPQKTGKHEGPYGEGHLGDLPALYVTADGRADNPVLAPRLKSIAELRGHALMVHVGGDNHSDHPATLGGGGARLACGVIQ